MRMMSSAYALTISRVIRPASRTRRAPSGVRLGEVAVADAPWAGPEPMFEAEALASASIAQVHEAILPDGREVVVKVVRPGIRRQIRRDIDLLMTIAQLAEKYWEDAARVKPPEFVREFEMFIFDELDMNREAANASAARIDARPGGPFMLAIGSEMCFCGAPFDLEATPNFRARMQESGFPWPPRKPIEYPLKTW